MKKIIAGILSALLLLSLAACGASPTASEENTQTQPTDSAAETTEPEQTIIEESEDNTVDTTMESKILVAYFSLAGEQYNVGVVEEGNTSIIAHMIAEQTGADLFEITPVTPYPTTYNGLLQVSQQEMSENDRPEIDGSVDNMADYDVVFIGYPNWWGDMPMIVYNFLESYDFAGKTVIPFCTHGGSGLSGTEKTIAGICEGATMQDGLAVAGTTAQNDRDSAEKAVTEWLNKITY